MKEMTLRDVQEFSLVILQHIHDFCVTHDIQYSIAYGTLIGAVRHKGFIPWDDDIDIVMTRPNFDRFCKEYIDSEDYKLIAPGKGSYVAYARVCDMGKTIVEDRTLPWCNVKTGLWIDIFPLDSCSDDEEDFKKEVDCYYKSWRRSLSIRKGYADFSVKKGFLKKVKLLLKKIVYCKTNPIKSLTDALAKRDYHSSNHIGNYSFMRYKYKEHYNKEAFSSYTLIDFENKKFMVMGGYDEVLRTVYGDYMKLPPVEKRVPIHSFHKNYWK